jgi:hypothetical protein
MKTLAAPRLAAVPMTAEESPGRAARRVVLAVLAVAGLIGIGLLAVSFAPSGLLLGRLLGAAGEAGRGGANTQELATYFDQRLRLASGLILALVAGLAVVRGPLEEMVAAAQRDAVWSRPRVRIERATLLLVGLPTLLAVAVRVPFLSQPMRYDEALTFNEFASRPLYYALSYYPDPNNHLLNTLLMHLASLGLSNQPSVLRLPAFLAGVLLVPASFWLARLLYDTRVAVLAAVLVAVGSYLVEYSTNARGYTLQALCFVVLLALVIVAVRRRSLSALLLAALVGALGAYDLPTMLYGVAIAGVCFCLWSVAYARPLRARVPHLFAAGLVLGLLVVLLYLPVLVISGADKLISNRFVVPLGWTEFGPELARSLGRTWEFWNRDVPWPLVALLVVGFGIGAWFELRKRQVPLGLLALLICLMFVAAQRVAPFERVWLFLLPLYLIIASAGLARFVDGRLLAIGFGLVLGYLTLTSGSILNSTETGAFPDAEAVTSALAPRLAPDDAVVTRLPASLPELQYYFPRYGLSTALLVRPAEEGQSVWVVAPPGVPPDVAGFSNVSEVQRFSGASLYQLRR